MITVISLQQYFKCSLATYRKAEDIFFGRHKHQFGGTKYVSILNNLSVSQDNSHHIGKKLVILYTFYLFLQSIISVFINDKDAVI